MNRIEMNLSFNFQNMDVSGDEKYGDFLEWLIINDIGLEEKGA